MTQIEKVNARLQGAYRDLDAKEAWYADLELRDELESDPEYTKLRKEIGFLNYFANLVCGANVLNSFADHSVPEVVLDEKYYRQQYFSKMPIKNFANELEHLLDKKWVLIQNRANVAEFVVYAERSGVTGVCGGAFTESGQYMYID